MVSLLAHSIEAIDLFRISHSKSSELVPRGCQDPNNQAFRTYWHKIGYF